MLNGMRLIFILLFLASPLSHAGWFSPDNYWECILDNMDQVQSDTIAKQVTKTCKDSYPIHTRIFIEKKKPWFGVKTASQCTIKHGKQVKSEVAAAQIQAACYKLYDDE